MRVTPALHLSHVPCDNVLVEIEGNGVYRVTKRSLTGKGTHTRWFYPEESESQGNEEKGMFRTTSVETARAAPVTSSSSFISCIGGTLSTISSRDTIPETEVASGEDDFDDWEVHAGSDVTEILDEEVEAERLWRLKTLRDGEPLPNLPYERIMMRISQEPTVILDNAI
ncbi:hypothetical protein D9756_009373 [Leucocoprinus leucothites]|uniref:Uncharacterized protein n=1 Tax=Leucocoprinus leucothites TaxID=201217 RepID=A0A8H5CW94_9AGAR|nr:hypothetical protein D9756_009373 [Leucoagaricus leucothites]